MARQEESDRVSAQKALKRKILAMFQQLPSNRQKVANYILQRPNELAFHTTDSLAAELGVSKATIVRFAQNLGYDGFTSLQRVFVDALRSDLSNIDKIIGAAKKSTRTDPLASVAESEIRNIEETLAHIDRGVFNAVVGALLKARRVYTMGAGISSLMAHILAYELTQTAIDALPISSNHMRFIELLGRAGREDVVVGFSFPPYTRETIEAAAYAKRRKAQVVAITDAMTSPITFEATHAMVVQTKNMLYINSISAISVVINALVTEVAINNKRTVSIMTRDIEQALEDTGQYHRG